MLLSMVNIFWCDSSLIPSQGNCLIYSFWKEQPYVLDIKALTWPIWIGSIQTESISFSLLWLWNWDTEKLHPFATNELNKYGWHWRLCHGKPKTYATWSYVRVQTRNYVVKTGELGMIREEEGKREKKSCVSGTHNTWALLKILFLIWGLEKRKYI